MNLEEDVSLDKFKVDVAKFSGNYSEFLVVVKRKDGNISWKSSDTTWAVGACARYIAMMDEMDRDGERNRKEEL
jgi:allantoicase